MGFGGGEGCCVIGLGGLKWGEGGRVGWVEILRLSLIFEEGLIQRCLVGVGIIRL